MLASAVMRKHPPTSFTSPALAAAGGSVSQEDKARLLAEREAPPERCQTRLSPFWAPQREERGAFPEEEQRERAKNGESRV